MGKGVPKNEEEAVQWYRKAAEQGFAQAQYNLGVCYHYGVGVLINLAEATQWYHKAVAQGYPDAKTQLVKLEQEKKSRQTTQSPEQLFTIGCNYYYGENGKSIDYAQAIQWFNQSAELGYTSAQYNLGVCYKQGQGVAKNEVEAVRWYYKAAEQGHKGAQYNLGVCYRHGQGVAKNEAEAVKWYRMAAEQGHVAAQNNLGVCYEEGYGVPKNQVEAAKWYGKAAEQGQMNAQYNLAVFYTNGQGVPKNLAQAKNWYTKAAAQGHPDAKTQLAKLGAEQTPYNDYSNNDGQITLKLIRTKQFTGSACTLNIWIDRVKCQSLAACEGGYCVQLDKGVHEILVNVSLDEKMDEKINVRLIVDIQRSTELTLGMRISAKFQGSITAKVTGGCVLGEDHNVSIIN